MLQAGEEALGLGLITLGSAPESARMSGLADSPFVSRHTLSAFSLPSYSVFCSTSLVSYPVSPSRFHMAKDHSGRGTAIHNSFAIPSPGFQWRTRDSVSSRFIKRMRL